MHKMSKYHYDNYIELEEQIKKKLVSWR
jgi:hypothetical protein